MYFRERLAVPAFLATGAYDWSYLQMVGRCGRRWATHILFTASTSSAQYGTGSMFKADFETLSRARFRKSRVHAKALNELRSLVILSLGPQAS